MENITYTPNEMKLADNFPKGSDFVSIADFKELFVKSALANSVAFRVAQRNKTSITLKCKNINCIFKVIARYCYISTKCIIRQMTPHHSCDLDAHPMKQKCNLSTITQSSQIEGLKPRSLMTKIKHEYGITVPYNTAWSAIQSIRKKEGLILEKSYSYIPSLVELIKANGDFSYYSQSSENRFQRFFISWEASKNFFEFSRKMIYIDGTFLSGPNKGTLLVAVSQDSCDQLVPIAFGIVESENSSSWSWFLEKLNCIIQLNKKEIIIFSDREKGIINSANNIAPLSSKAYCSRHIARNFRTVFRNNRLKTLFWQIVNTYSTSEFNKCVSEMKTISLEFYERLNAIGFHTFANSQFPVPRYGKTTSNPVESMNSAVKKFIDFDVTNLIISLNNYAMKLFYEKKQKTFQLSIVDECNAKLMKNVAKGRLLTIERSSNNIFLVDHKHIVNMQQNSCACKEEFDNQIPCKHLCAVFGNCNFNPVSFVSTIYSSHTYYNSCSKSILPLSTIGILRSELNPPEDRRARGRPRIKRIKNLSEQRIKRPRVSYE